jgi:hypothetical protein
MGFALEPRAEMLTRNLNGDETVKARVACSVHFTHTSLADKSKNFIWA